jgi:chemotaxis protein MotB
LGSKRKKSEAADAPDLVMIMTVSLFIILLAFFILLNSIAVVDQEKRMEVLDSLLGSFGVLAGGQSVVEGGAGGMALPDMSGLTSHVDFSDLMIGAEDLIHLIQVAIDDRGTLLSIPAHMLFEDGTSVLTPVGKKRLDKLFMSIKKNDYPVEILGHTDNRKPGPAGPSNRELSAIRAMRVLNYFLAKDPRGTEQYSACGWGEFRPVVSNKTKETRRVNQRMEFFFVHDLPAARPEGVFTFKKFFFNVLD